MLNIQSGFCVVDLDSDISAWLLCVAAICLWITRESLCGIELEESVN